LRVAVVFAVNAPATLNAPFATVFALIVTPAVAVIATVLDAIVVSRPFKVVLLL